MSDDCKCDPEEEFRQSQEAQRKLAQRLANGRLRQVAKKIKEQHQWDNAPRHTEYQGRNENGGLVQPLGSGVLARKPISNGWLRPGDVVRLGQNDFDFKKSVKPEAPEEPPAPEVCSPRTIYKFISLKGTVQYLPFKFVIPPQKPTESQLKRKKTRWRLVEVGAGGSGSVEYEQGYVDKQKFVALSSGGNLFDAANSSFASRYDYPGYMQLQIGCYDGKKVIWKLKK